MKTPLAALILACAALYSPAADAQDGSFAVPAQAIAEHADPVPPPGIVDTARPIVVNVAPSPAQVAREVRDVRSAIKGGDYAAAAAGALMLLVWALRRVLKEGWLSKRPNLIPWATLALSCSVGALGSLAAGFPFYESLFAGAVVGLSASGGWSLIGKHLLPPPSAPAQPPIAVRFDEVKAKADPPVDGGLN